MSTKASKPDLPVKPFATVRDCERWFEAEHANSPGIWMRIAKQGSGVASVTYAEAIEIALCFGWIDGQKRPLDARFWLQMFTPRSPRSRWSAINRDKAEALEKSGRMRPAGLAAVAQAKADGRWDRAYASQSRAEVPPDLAAALGKNRAAREFFETLESHNRYAILYRVHDAKRPETRARRIAEFVAMLAERKTLHPRTRKTTRTSS